MFHNIICSYKCIKKYNLSFIYKFKCNKFHFKTQAHCSGIRGIKHFGTCCYGKITHFLGVTIPWLHVRTHHAAPSMISFLVYKASLRSMNDCLTRVLLKTLCSFFWYGLHILERLKAQKRKSVKYPSSTSISLIYF